MALIPTEFKALQEGHTDLKAQVAQLQIALQQNTATTTQIKQDTAEIISVFAAIKGGLSVLEWMGKIGSKLFWLGLPGAIAYTWWGGIKTWIGKL